MWPIQPSVCTQGRKNMRTPLKHKSWRSVTGFAACFLLSACTTAGWQAWLYDIGDQYAWQRSGSLQRDAQARAALCADAEHPDRTNYKDYAAARTQTGTTGQ